MGLRLQKYEMIVFRRISKIKIKFKIKKSMDRHFK